MALLLNKTKLDWVALIITLIGSVNWGLVGTLNFDLVDFLFGRIVWLPSIVYSIVALAGIYLLYAVARPTGASRPAAMAWQPPKAPTNTMMGK